MTELAWPIVALVALALVWLRTRPMGRKQGARLLELENARGGDRADILRARIESESHGAALADLKKRLERLELPQLGRLGR